MLDSRIVSQHIQMVHHDVLDGLGNYLVHGAETKIS